MKKNQEKVSVERGRMNDARYINALEASNRGLNSENRRLVNLLISIIEKREKELDKCSKCLLKNKQI
jgi:protein involved in polysaccharide export with SLBB domain